MMTRMNLKHFIPVRIRIFLVVTINRITGFTRFLLLKINHSLAKEYFTFNGKTYEYFVALYNTTFQNERAVEIPVILKYIDDYKNKKILEIGNVLSHYLNFNHDIIDKYEKANGVINCDIVDFNPSVRYDLIISISTFEHIGFDEASRYSQDRMLNVQQKILLEAIEKTKGLLEVDGLFVFTVPLGYNFFLDSQIKHRKLELTDMLFFKRISLRNEWNQVIYSDVSEVEYGRPFSCANGLMIGIFKNN
jgi:hypothetical protein